MKKLVRGLVLVLSATVMVSSFSGCGSSSTSSKNEKDPVELKFYMMGEESKQYRKVEDVLAEFEKRTKNTLNTKINITWAPSGDYKQKLPMWIAAGEDIDLLFDAPWISLEKMAKDGAYVDLEKYMNNDQYPGLKKAFSEEYVNDNKFFEKLYGLPLTNAFMDMEGVVYRKDLLEKYGMKPIGNYDDLYQFLSNIQANEPNMVPYGPYGTNGFFKLFLEPSKRQLEGKVFTFTDAYMGYIDVAIAPDGKSVAGAAVLGDPDENYKGFDQKYGKQYIMDYFNNCLKFGKFLPKDVLANGAGTGKDAAAGYTTLSGFLNAQSQLKAKIPTADLTFWPIYKNSQDMTPGAQSTDYKAWNFACIPASSKKADATMKFLDWAFSNQENNDLFSYGIEGVHWNAVGSDKWKIKDGVDVNNNYLFPAYELSQNPNYNRIPAGLPDTINKYYEYEFKKETYQKNLLAGFSFDQESVSTEIAKCAPIVNKYLPVLRCGLEPNPEEALKKFNQEMVAAGADKIKDELVKQLNTFLANKK